MHALIIEPEANISLSIAADLRTVGYGSFAFATTAEGAVLAGRDRGPDLIVAELELKLGCGIEAVEAICGRRPVPIIFMSEKRRGVPEGFAAAEMIHKPLLSGALAATVMRVRRASRTGHGLNRAFRGERPA